MLSGLYSAATAMDAASHRHDVVAFNLAHAAHPGFRRHVPVDGTFESALMSESADPNAAPALSTLGAKAGEAIVDFTPGPLVETGRPLDFAIQGDQGFFVVEGPNGKLYTRNGSFQVDPEGQLITMDGLPVSNGSGPIKIPKDVVIADLRLSTQGDLMAGDQKIAKLAVVEFKDQSVLQPVGISLFQAPDDAEPEPSKAVVRQGSREGSNVSAALELVRMIDGMRQYEAAARALQSITEAVQQNVNPASA